jgi:tetratricopeptide (TPR) repeat protein
VERLLEAQLGDDDSTGFFEGQFKDLEAFGRAKATPILIRILSERMYVFRRAHRRHEPENFRNTMKELAVMALGEIGGEGALPALRAFLGDQVQMRLSVRIQEETLVALYRQGDKQPLENHLRDTRHAVDDQLKMEAGDSRSDACDQLFSLGLLYNRIQRNDDAAKVYLELLETVEKYKLEKARERNVSSAYYNLACLSSIRGDRTKAVEWLQKSVRAGYVNRSWIQKDKDLDGIRNEEGYKKLLADDALFEKRKPDELPADR